MQTKSAPATGAVTSLAELDQEIDRLARFKLQKKIIEDLEAAAGAKIKSLMDSLQIARHVTATGCEALVIEGHKATWDVALLRAHLDPERFAALCPPTPKAADLKKLLEADPLLKATLAGCCRLEATETLRVTPSEFMDADDELPSPKDKPIDLFTGKRPKRKK